MNTYSSVPGGRLVVKSIPATAGNVATTLTPGSSNIRWMVVGWRLTLTTDVTVATRQIRITKREPGTNPIATVLAGQDRAASGTTIFSTTAVRYNNGNTQYPVDGAMCSIEPFCMQLVRSMDLYIQINNGVAGDSYSGYVEVIEFGEG